MGYCRSRKLEIFQKKIEGLIIIIIIIIIYSSRDSSVGVVTGYELDGQGSIPGRGKDFSLLHNVKIGSGSYQASYPMGIEGSFPGGKAAGA
jgi:hypothetical protein